MIHDVFTAYESFSVEKWLKCNVVLIILKIKNIIDIYIYINVDEKYLSHING